MTRGAGNAAVAAVVEESWGPDQLKGEFGIDGRLWIEDVLGLGDRLVLQTEERMYYSPVVDFDMTLPAPVLVEVVAETVRRFLTNPTVIAPSGLVDEASR